MVHFQTAVKFKFWLYTKARIGVYRQSVPRRLKKLAVRVQRDPKILAPFKQDVYFNEKWLEELRKCYKYGGYKKKFGKFYWSHKKFKYFDFKASIFDGAPNFIKSANLLLLKEIEYFPRALKPNEVSKYMFKVKKNKSSSFDFEFAISFDLGGADSFQHFVQDCLPIILMSKKILTSIPNLIILLPASNKNFPSQKELIRMLGITNQIIETDSKSFSIKNLYYWNFEPFNAKYILPEYWESILFKEYRKVNSNTKRNQIILITRNEKSRNFANLENIKKSLKNLAKDLNFDFKIIDSSVATLNDYKLEMPKAKVVLSMHGGANYNLIFCSEKTLFFEFIPMIETNTLINFFRHSGITYVPVPIDFRFKQSSDVAIPEEKLKEIQEISKQYVDEFS